MSDMNPKHSHCAHGEDVGAYALHALDDADARAFATHLEGCADCRLELSDLQLVVDTLPMSAPQMLPSPALKDRIMAVVQAESELLLAAGPEADRVAAAAPGKRRRRLAWPSLGGMRPAWAGALACALLAVGVVGGVLVDNSGSPTEHRYAGITHSRATAMLDVTGDRGALELTNLPSLSQGRVYQVWIDRGDGRPRPTHTLFNVRSDGRAKVAIDESLAGVKKLLVTAERSGGAQTPSGKPIVTAALA